MNALKLSAKVKRIIDKHIRQKGYEVEAQLLSTPPESLNRDQLSIMDEGQEENLHQESIKIVVTAHDIDEEPTKLGDNPTEKLEFISIENDDDPDEKRVQEGRFLVYNSKRFNIILVSPATLAGQLIIKECKARSVV